MKGRGAVHVCVRGVSGSNKREEGGGGGGVLFFFQFFRTCKED